MSSSPLNAKTSIFVGLTTLVLVLDQITKYWVFNNIAYGTGEIVVIPGFFSLVHAQNKGAAFGVAGDMEYRHILFLGFTVVAFAVIVDLFRKLPSTDRFVSGILGLILGGALGNAWDRVDKGSVTDFLRIYTEYPPLEAWLIANFRTNEWPSFNIADSALVIGVCFFLVHYLFLEEPEDERTPSEAETG